MIFEKNRTLDSLIQKMLNTAEVALDEFIDAIQLHIENIHDGKFNFEVDSLNAFESSLDETVHEIKNELLTYSSIPLADDHVVLVNLFDRIINKMAQTLKSISARKMHISHELRAEYLTLLQHTGSCSAELITLVRSYYGNGNSKTIAQSVESVGVKETECDTAEDLLIEKLFTLDKDNAKKVTETQLIRGIGSIADRCEDLADHIAIVNLKTAE